MFSNNKIEVMIRTFKDDVFLLISMSFLFDSMDFSFLQLKCKPLALEYSFMYHSSLVLNGFNIGQD